MEKVSKKEGFLPVDGKQISVELTNAEEDISNLAEKLNLTSAELTNSLTKLMLDKNNLNKSFASPELTDEMYPQNTRH
jgi:hypothetical protein